MRRLRNLLLIGFLIVISSCDKLRVYDEYQHVGSSWHKDSIPTFNIKNPALKTPYNLFVNIRNNNEYAYSNLYVITKMEEPDGLTKVDTLQYLMANPDGTFIGEGFTDIKDNKLVYKLGYVFKKKGDYKFSVAQAVRKTGNIEGDNELKGITDVGFRIESIP